MQLLQLVESTDHVLLLSQFLSSLAGWSSFQVLLEVIFACLAIEFEQVVELLDSVQLIVAPQLVGFLGRNVLDFLPFVLQEP